MALDERKLFVLSFIVDEYIRTGEPVASKTILQNAGLNVSSATIRNDMAELERCGLLEQPHTSAGRIPTFLGYRLYIEKLMVPHVLSSKEKQEIDHLLGQNHVTAEHLLDTAVDVLSDLTDLTVINSHHIPQFSVISRVEVIPAGRRLYALVLITSTGEVKNRVYRLEFDLTNEQIAFFARFINEHISGMEIDRLTPAMLQKLAVALGSYMITLSPLLYAIYELSEEFMRSQIAIKGEEHLLQKSGLDFQETMRFLHEKQEINRLLSGAFDQVQVLFGKEDQSFVISNSSLIIAPYHVGGNQGGSLGVIGPVRLNYAKMIPYLKYFSEHITALLEDVFRDGEKQGGN